MNRVLTLNRKHKIQIEAPLISLDKKHIIEYGIQLGVDFSKTWTCYMGEEEACSDCSACSLRLRGFIDAGYIDPIRYKNQEKLNKVYIKNNCKPLNV